MVTKMTKYSFILLSGDTDAFLKQIQELGVVDITRSAKPVDTGSADMLDKAMDLKQTVNFLKTVDYSKDEQVKAIVAATKDYSLAEQPALCVNRLRTRLAELESRMTVLNREKEARVPWGEFDKDKLPAMAKDLKKCADEICSVIDWSSKQDVKDELRMEIAFVMSDYGFPPEYLNGVYEEVFKQMENYKRNSE